MEEARVVVSTSWQQSLQNEKYKNWLKVTHALSITCAGIRPYIEREAKAFHGIVTARLQGLPLCTCTYTRHPYHNTITCLWAKELLNYHKKGKPTWNQSNASLWNDPIVGHWEVAKLYMPYGCAKGNSCAETDATGLLNLLYWCNYYKIDSTLVEKVKDTRNAWAHAATQELDAANTTDALLSMKNFLQDAELIGDANAADALNEIIALENDDLIDFKDLETKVVNGLKKSMTSMKDELVGKIDSMKGQEDIHANEIKEEIECVKTMVSYCMKVGQEREDVLLNNTSVLCDIQDQMEVLLHRLENLDSRNEERSRENSAVKAMKYSLRHLSLWAIIFILKVLRGIPRKVILMIFLLGAITTLDENLDEIGCSARTKPADVHGLMEIDFTRHLNRAREGFVGRQWLFKDISNSLENDEFKGVMIIAAPGFGKSALMSNLICSKLSSFSLHSQILGYHLCIHSHKNTQNGAVFVRNLASMIAGRLQEYEGLVMKDIFVQRVLENEQCSSDPTACFEQGILTPLSRLRLRFLAPTMYIVIDALDECYNENEQGKGTSIVNILSNNMKMFPNWLKVIVTSRNVTDIRRTFSSLDVLDFLPEDPRNLQDIERFIFSQLRYSFLSQIKSFFVDDFSIQAMINKSQGNFLYIKLVLEYLQTKGVSAATWNSLPTSINSIYKEFFERKFDTKEKFRVPRKIFEILVATLSPLTTEKLYEVFVTNLKDTDVFDFEYDFLLMLEDLSMYLSSIQENQTVTVFHSSLTEWLTSNSNRGGRFYVDVKKGNQLFADYYFKKIHEKSVNITTQFVYNLATYIVRGSSTKHVYEFKNLNQKLVQVCDISKNITALHIAAGEENERTVALLLNFFEKVDIEDNKGRTPAFYAARFDRVSNLRLLYQKGASLAHMTSTLTCGSPNIEEDDVQDCEHQMCGYSLLHVASQRGHQQTMKFLLENNVSVSTLSGSGYSALHLAAKYNHSETIKTLMENGAVPDGRCLYYAAMNGNSMAIRVFLENGAEDICMNCSEISNGYFKGQCNFLNLEDRQNYRQDCNTALHIAAIKNLSKIAKLLLKSTKKAVHCINFYGKDPLLEAVEKSHLKVTKLLLKSEANPSSICHYYSILDSLPFSCPCGYTPLHVAAHSGAAAITNLLLKYKADYNARDCEGLQPIHVASCYGHTDILSILVEKGADINSKGPSDMTPIHYACKCQNDGIFDKLFELGANGTAITSDGNTPLHYIIQKNSIDEEFSLMDPYVATPIEPIDANYRSVIENPFKHKYPWMISMIRFLASFRKAKSYDSESLNRLNLMSVFGFHFITNVSTSMLGGLEASSWKFVVLASPLFYAYDIGALSDSQNLKDMLDSRSEAHKLLFKAITRNNTNCLSLVSFIENNLIYYFDYWLEIGNDVNCKDSESSTTPLLAYLRQGGRNMAKVLVKHGVTVDIRCGELFMDSAFHLAAYHKLHYLQYLSVFRDPVKWVEYLEQENALFDYLFDEYDKITVGEQVKVVRERDGPVTKAIKSHPRGYEIIDECLDDEGYTALHRAAQGGNFVAVKRFLDWGANATKESPEGFDALTLAIWYAVKYRPYFNFHKLNILTSLEIDFASFTASAILSHLTRDKPFHVGCNDTKSAPTLLHLAATRGMWRFINDLFVARDHYKVTGLTPNCPTKDNITPMYLAKLHGGDDCDWDNPWCKVVGVLLKYGASMIYPDPLTEYSLVFNFLFHEVPGRLDLHLDKDELKMLQDVMKEFIRCNDFEDFDITDVFESDIVFLPTSNSNIYVYRNGIEKMFLDVTHPLFKTVDEFERMRNIFKHFLTLELNELRSIFVYLKNMDDVTLRCIRPNYQDQPRQISEEQSKSDMMHLEELVKLLNDIERELRFMTDIRKPSISFPSHEYTAAALNLNMCSPEAAAKMFKTIESCLDNNRQVFRNYRKSLSRELKTAKQVFQQYLLELGRSDSSVIRTFKSYEKNLTCPIKMITYQYLKMKFLLKTIRLWDRQVRKISVYPSISKFVAQRITDVFLNDNAKEMTRFILELASETPSDKYKYLKMLRFTKAPMFDRTLFSRD